jgi:hypothetical protein
MSGRVPGTCITSAPARRRSGRCAAGLEWRESTSCQQWIKKADSEKITKVPASLDLTPYLDEKDTELINVMQRALVP